MLIGFLVLWQGIGWATVYYYDVDGVNYSIRKSTTNHYARVHSIDNNATGTIRIPASITYKGETYPVTQIDVRISSAAKDIYFTRVLPNSISANVGVDETAAFEGYFKKVPSSMFQTVFMIKLLPNLVTNIIWLPMEHVLVLKQVSIIRKMT